MRRAGVSYHAACSAVLGGWRVPLQYRRRRGFAAEVALAGRAEDALLFEGAGRISRRAGLRHWPPGRR